MWFIEKIEAIRGLGQLAEFSCVCPAALQPA